MDFFTWFLLLVILLMTIGWANSKPLFWLAIGLLGGYFIAKNKEPIEQKILKIKEIINDAKK